MASFVYQNLAFNTQKAKNNKFSPINQKAFKGKGKAESNLITPSIKNRNNEFNGSKNKLDLRLPVCHDFNKIPLFSPSPLGVQPKLKINTPGDKFEREADRMADHIMRMPNPVVQRKCAACEKEEEEKDSIFRKAQNSSNKEISNPGLVNELKNSKGNGQPLDTSSKSFMEARFNTDLTGVRIHTDQRANKMNQNLNARAFTHGSDIYFNRNEYKPGSPEGKRILAHELTHVVQQSSSGPLIQRLTSKRINPNLVEVQHNNEKYRVTRKVTVGKRRGTTTGSVKGDIDQTNISLTINVCRNKTRGSVQLGANVPERVREIAQNIVQAATQGSISDIEQTLQGADVTPFVEILLAQSGQFSLTARGEVTVGLEGVTAGGGSLKIQKGPFGGSITGRGNEQGWQVTGNVTFTPGRKEEKFECTKIPTTISIECQKWHDPSKQRVPVQVPFYDKQTRFIYFDFEKSTIDRVRSADMLNEITSLLQQGYRVSKITGHTSPEGPMQPGRRFIGNEQLGKDRANKALEEIKSICQSSMLAMRNPKRCVSDATLNVEPLGMGELFTRVNEQGRELQGQELAKHAVGKFKTAKSESLHRDEKMLKRMEKMSLKEQRDIVFPLLRRATVILVKSGMKKELQTVTVPGGYRIVNCPLEVESAARILFNL